MLGIEERIAQEVAELETLIESKVNDLDYSSEIETAVQSALEDFDWSEAENHIDWSSVFYNAEIINRDEVREEAEDVLNDVLDDKLDEFKSDNKIDVNSDEFKTLVNLAVSNYLKDANFTLKFNTTESK